MSKHNEFDEIPSLIPDSDEIKSSRSRLASQDKHSVTRRSVSVEHRQSPGNLPPRAANYGSQSKRQESQVTRSGGRLPLLLISILTLAISAVGYWYHNQLEKMDMLLATTKGELDHSLRRIGELEAIVVETDANANQSGSVMLARVKMLDERSKARTKLIDSELSKLWGVANQTNRPAITENQNII